MHTSARIVSVLSAVRWRQVAAYASRRNGVELGLLKKIIVSALLATHLTTVRSDHHGNVSGIGAGLSANRVVALAARHDVQVLEAALILLLLARGLITTDHT